MLILLKKAEKNNIYFIGPKSNHTYNGSKLPKKQLKPIIFNGSRLDEAITDIEKAKELPEK
jgi:hypothetical protein